MKVLVTGGLGYIGSHTVAAMTDRGWDVDVIDDLHNNENYDFVQDRCTNLWTRPIQDGLMPLMRDDYDAVVHLAAFISVADSVVDAHNYWSNNLTSLMHLHAIPTGHLIFASTGTAFNPTNPYARTKVACENYIHDVFNSHHTWFDGHTIFRFYNVSGLRAGLVPTGQPTHLIRLAAMAARENGTIKVFGTTYDTPDGTAVRDYIHVEDIASSICAAVENGPSNSAFECLGTGTGHSVLEVVQSMKRVTGVDFGVTMQDRRIGDDAAMVCPSQYKHLRITKTLDDMCRSAYENA